MKWLAGWRERDRMTAAANETILLCLRYGIGDLVMSLPSIESLRGARPDAWITALGAEPAVELLENTGLVDEIVSMQQWRIAHGYDYGTEQTAAAVRQWLAGRDFDVVYDPRQTAPVITSEIYTLCKRVYDRDISAEKRLLAEGFDGVSAIRESTSRGWDIDIDPDAFPQVVATDEERVFADDFMIRNVSDEAVEYGVIGISPAASSPLKTWPIARCVDVIDLLTDRGCSCILFAGPRDYRACEWIADHSKAPQRLAIAAGLHLRHVAAIMTRCEAYLGNDSWLMHLAAAVGIPVTAVFGPTDPGVYLPRWVSAAAAITPTHCKFRKRSAFGHPSCVEIGDCLTGLDCIKQVSTQEVFDSVLNYLASREKNTCGRNAHARAEQTAVS